MVVPVVVAPVVVAAAVLLEVVVVIGVGVVASGVSTTVTRVPQLAMLNASVTFAQYSDCTASARSVLRRRVVKKVFSTEHAKLDVTGICVVNVPALVSVATAGPVMVEGGVATPASAAV